MTPTGDDSPKPLQPGQYSLLGLLSFMLAWSVYFSTIAVFGQILPDGGYRESHGLPVWLGLLIFFLAWVVLALLYRAWGLWPASTVHYSGLVMALGLCLLGALVGVFGEGPLSTWQMIKDAVEALSVIIPIACFFSTLISLPMATLMLAYLVLKRRDT